VTNERVLVAAPYPTMPGPEAAATFELVRKLVDDGADVVVASPRPSAAHAVADPGGPRGAARLASLAGGCDRVIVRLDASGVAADADPPLALPGRLGLAAALRRAGRAEVVLDRVPPSVSRRWASLVLGPASLVTVASDEERDALVRAGVDVAKVRVEAPAAASSGGTRQQAPRSTGKEGLGGAVGAEAIEAQIRRRAAETRRTADAGPGGAGEASRPLRHLVPLERPEVRTRKPGVATIKRAQLRVLGWMFDWVIQHVNRLHQATIDAVQQLEAQSKSTR
jgi:hypothetical protein